MKDSERIAAEVKDLEQEHALLIEKRNHMEGQLKTITARIDALDGGFWGGNFGGLIEKRKRDMKAAQGGEDDEARERVEVKSPYGRNEEYVLRRITAKSIFVASPGCSSEMRFGLDGKGPYGEIVGHEEILKRHGKNK